MMVFADQIVKLNRRSKPERRDLVVTTKAMYFVMRKKIKGEIVYTLTRRTDIAQIGSISLSTMQDNYIIVHVPSEYDNLFENEHKTELCMVLSECYTTATGRTLQINFSDSIQYTIKTKDKRTVNFAKSEGCSTAVLKKAGKSLTVNIASGLPKDTDTTPQGFANRGAQRSTPASSAGRGAGRGAGAGAAAGAGRGGGGRGGPAAGGAGVAAAAAAGGAGRGGPAAGGAGRGGPGAGAGRGGPGAGAGRGGPGAGRGAPGPGAGRGGPGAGRGRGAPAAAPKRPTAKALYDYTANSDDELSFRAGDVLFVVQKDSGGWWECELNGKRGWTPANFLAAD